LEHPALRVVRGFLASLRDAECVWGLLSQVFTLGYFSVLPYGRRIQVQSTFLGKPRLRSPLPANPGFVLRCLQILAFCFASSNASARLQSIQMSDTLYLSLWYPNLRLEALPDKLAAVLGAFAAHGGEQGVYSATVWPINWTETPIFQHVWGRGGTTNGKGMEPRPAVQQATDLLHDDYAYEFQIGWSLWELEFHEAGPSTPHRSAQEDSVLRGLDARWAREPRLVRVTGFGPLFDEGAYEADGHIRIDFGSDTPFLEEDADLDTVGARHVEENVRQLVELTAAVEKASGATARLLWSELGESLAQRLAARLGVRN